MVTATQSRFTGKERDSETGLDYFGARYYGSSMGRFLTPDWAAKPTAVPYAEFGDPQSLNLYGYVRNNPLSKADPDGHCDWCLALVAKVTTYVASRPDLAKAVDRLQDSLGVKVTGSLGGSREKGPVKGALAISLTAETRADGTGSAALQATAGASVAGAGGQANGIATFEKNGAFVNPLANLSGNAKLTGSGSQGDNINSNVAVGTDDRAALGIAGNIGVASAGIQLTAGMQEVKEFMIEVGNSVIQDSKQLIRDAQTANTCGMGECSVSPQQN